MVVSEVLDTKKFLKIAKRTGLLSKSGVEGEIRDDLYFWAKIDPLEINPHTIIKNSISLVYPDIHTWD